MIRTLLLCLGLAACLGCSATRKTQVTHGPGVESPDSTAVSPDSPKQYKYRDMSLGGGSGFSRSRAGSGSLVR